MISSDSLPVKTIAAISTAPGAGGVAIVRVSGPVSLPVLNRVFKPNGDGDWRPRQMRFGRVTDSADGSLLDEALAVWFPRPKSFTGEDVVEIQGHGGPVVAAQVLRAVLRAGAELAEPGEFTRRAFMNGRLDLTQAEAVADLVAARSEAEAALAARQLSGRLSEKIEAIHQALFSALVDLEAGIDFSDDVEPLDMDGFQTRLASDALIPLNKLLEDGRNGRPFKDGLRLALVGAPNVGKSSLFNVLVGVDRALVSPTPGTTRDFITTDVIWDGLRVELCDTAGLSETPVNDLDALGQERSRAQLERADIVLWVGDCTRPDESRKNLESLLPLDMSLLVWNKIDLGQLPQTYEEGGLGVSARTGRGLEELKSAILRLATGRSRPVPPEVVPNLRHQALLTRAGEFLSACLAAAAEGQPPDICAYELRSALDSLGAIRGRTTPDDILEEIFSRFCLGK